MRRVGPPRRDRRGERHRQHRQALPEEGGGPGEVRHLRQRHHPAQPGGQSGQAGRVVQHHEDGSRPMPGAFPGGECQFAADPGGVAHRQGQRKGFGVHDRPEVMWDRWNGAGSRAKKSGGGNMPAPSPAGCFKA